MQKQFDVLCAASRGRKEADNKYIQRLEVLGNDYTNTITSVCKDNLIIEVYDAKKKQQYGGRK